MHPHKLQNVLKSRPRPSIFPRPENSPFSYVIPSANDEVIFMTECLGKFNFQRW